jgi:hypothetical protein
MELRQAKKRNVSDVNVNANNASDQQQLPPDTNAGNAFGRESYTGGTAEGGRRTRQNTQQQHE